MLRNSRIIEAFCSYPFQRLKVTPEGNVTMCCFQTRKCLGNILEESFEEVWFGAIAESIRRDTLRNKLHTLCKVEACPFYHRESLEKLSIRANQFPLQFEIDLPTQHCNIGGEDPNDNHPACMMCERHTNYVKQVDRLDEVCKVLRNYIKFVDAVHIQGVAEPFWKERIFEIINLLTIGKYKEKIRISTTTNGTIFTKDKRDKWRSFPNTTTTFSLDAASPRTFEKLRRVNMYDKISEYITSYCKEKSSRQWVHIHNNINLINIDEVVGMVEFAAKVGVEMLDFNATYSTPGICVDATNYKLFRRAQFDIIEAAKRLNVKTTFMRNLTLDYDKDTNWTEVLGKGEFATTGAVNLQKPLEIPKLVQIELPQKVDFTAFP